MSAKEQHIGVTGNATYDLTTHIRDAFLKMRWIPAVVIVGCLDETDPLYKAVQAAFSLANDPDSQLQGVLITKLTPDWDAHRPPADSNRGNPAIFRRNDELSRICDGVIVLRQGTDAASSQMQDACAAQNIPCHMVPVTRPKIELETYAEGENPFSQTREV